ncbi:MAG: agmatine deiminase family protein [Bacteroidota bacterium]
MLRKSLLITALFASSFSLFAQYPAHKLPAYKTTTEIQLATERRTTDKHVFGKGGFIMPAKVRYPGEYEESQAVAISWSPDYDNNGNIIGVDTYSVFGYVSAQLAKYISDELPVWIRVPFAGDTLKVKAFMNDLGWPLTNNYVFLITTGDDWWIRDYGPNGVYLGDKDSALAFIDLKYYDGRDNDDIYPKVLANYMGIQNFESRLYGEGGNLMSDGFGSVFFSDMFMDANQQQRGWNQTQILDSITNLLGATRNVKLQGLQCDGGTSHIDLYTKLIDEQTLLVMQYPSIITAADKRIIEDNYQYMTTLKSTYNRPYRIYRFPMPTGDTGTYNRKNCAQIDGDARTYINGITLNKTFIYPTYSDDFDGNKTQSAEAQAIYEKYLPGYKVIPIDARAVSPGGGSIHCITMQIPANNNVLFWHPSVDGFQPIQANYAIQARITNISGIATAECKWKLRGTSTWNSVTLTSDTTGLFTGNITPGTVTSTDFIDYYLTATTNNGKTAVKPITAPDGFYTIRFTENPTAVEDLEVRAKNYLFGAYPNPASSRLTIPYQLTQTANTVISIMDITGKEIKRIERSNAQSGLTNEEIDVTQMHTGIYFYTLYANGNRIDSRKFIVR